MIKELKRTWAYIDLDNAEHNFKLIKSMTDKKVCAVIKANGYGHGAVQLGKLYQDLGADFFAVSNIEEAIQLRNNQITLPILVLGYTPIECAKLLVKYDIHQTVFSFEYANALVNKCKERNIKVKVHLKFDTGMGRIGFTTDDYTLDELVKILSKNIVDVQGAFTHFAVADEAQEGKDYTEAQAQKFDCAVKYLEQKGIKTPIKHCSNSAGIIDYKPYHFDMVRAGIILYGLPPSNKVGGDIGLKKVMQLTSVVSHVKTIEKGQSVSYGRTFTATDTMKVATVPMGYADGFWRINGNGKYSLKVNGKYATIIGRICMDQLMLDVTSIDCKVGDEVFVFGQDEYCSTEQIAKINQTINYEVVCAVGERVPRVYLKGGKVVSYQDNLIDVNKEFN